MSRARTGSLKRVLMVSPRFVPVSSADMHRVRQSLPYLHEFGWEAVVLAVAPEQCEAPRDPLLEHTIPSDVEIVRTPAIDIRRTRRLGLGNLDLRALPYLARAGDRLLAGGAFDLVYFSTTAFSVLALGPYWRRRHGTPFVVDLQDPWLSDYYDQPGAPEPPGGRRKYAVVQRLARTLEPFTMRRVSAVISVSPLYPEILLKRYPWMRRDQFTTLPFGAPELDFRVLEDRRVRQAVYDPADGLEHWVYTGRAGADMRFSLEALFTAMAAARQQDPDRFSRLRLHFVGTSYAPRGRARKTVQPVAEACGVADLVEEAPERIAYFEALRCLADAHALIVPGSDDPGYTASKLYPYILARKPLLAIFQEQSSVVDVLNRTGAGTVVTFGPADTIEAVAGWVRRAWLASAEPPPPATDWSAFRPYTAREMTRRQCEVFDRAAAHGAGE